MRGPCDSWFSRECFCGFARNIPLLLPLQLPVGLEELPGLILSCHGSYLHLIANGEKTTVFLWWFCFLLWLLQVHQTVWPRGKEIWASLFSELGSECCLFGLVIYKWVSFVPLLHILVFLDISAYGVSQSLIFSCQTVIKLWSSSSVGAPWWTYWSAGITNTIGPAMGIEALKYISYPAQARFTFSWIFFPYWLWWNMCMKILIQIAHLIHPH